MSSVAERFSKLITRIQPTASELARYGRHLQTVRQRVTAVFDSPRVSLMGSHARETAIRGHSDLDILLQLPHREIRWANNYMQSTSVLRRVRQELSARYPQTEISVSGPAVVVKFGGHPVDVVPAVFVGMKNQSEVLAIPDGVGGWMDASPKAHGRYLNDSDSATGGKLKYTAQLLKFWRHTRAVPIPLQSFHAEMLLATSGVCTGAKPYSECLRDAFIALDDTQYSGLFDPLGISGMIPIGRTHAQSQRVHKALSRTVDQAIKARDAEERGDPKKACEWWDKVFKGQFPK